LWLSLALGCAPRQPPTFDGTPEVRTADLTFRDDPGCPCRTAEDFESVSPDLPVWVDGDPATAACDEHALVVQLPVPLSVDRLTLYPGDLSSGAVTSAVARFVVRTEHEAIVLQVPEIPPGAPGPDWIFPEVLLSGRPVRSIQVAVERHDAAEPPCWSGIGIQVRDPG